LILATLGSIVASEVFYFLIFLQDTLPLPSGFIVCDPFFSSVIGRFSTNSFNTAPHVFAMSVCLVLFVYKNLRAAENVHMKLDIAHFLNTVSWSTPTFKTG